MVYDEDIHRAFLRFQFETQLLLNGGEDRWFESIRGDRVCR
jgi:hypothetical protein